jgi:prephenate dehydrogenase
VRPATLAVIGLEAIGVSLARQARRAGVPRVIGYSPIPATAVRALKAEAISDMALSPEQAVRDANLIVIAARSSDTIRLVASLAAHAPPDAFLTDVGSVKGPVCRAATGHGLTERFAGSHPLPRAGEHATDRFRHAVVYVCPTDPMRGEPAARQIMHFWSEVMEAAPVLIEAERHDQQIAWTRHLPQAVSSVLAKTLAERRLGGVSFGSGARDATRLAASSPEEWADLLMENAEPVLEALTNTEHELSALKALLEARDAEKLRDYLQRAADFRRGLA